VHSAVNFLRKLIEGPEIMKTPVVPVVHVLGYFGELAQGNFRERGQPTSRRHFNA
jgi:hypothetical protein